MDALTRTFGASILFPLAAGCQLFLADRPNIGRDADTWTDSQGNDRVEDVALAEEAGGADTDFDGAMDASEEAAEELDVEDAEEEEGPLVIPEYVTVTAGTFTMGSPPGEAGRDSDEAQHVVTLTYDFEIMTHEVTKGDFAAHMGYDPSYFPACGADCPVEQATWHEALFYANRVSADAGLPECFDCAGAAPDFSCRLKQGYSRPQDCPGYRLPTEAEWEYAARAGSATAFHSGDITTPEGCGTVDAGLDAIGWYCGNSAVSYGGCYDLGPHGGGPACAGPHPIEGKAPNAFGLYDMSGNVWEWVWDWYGVFLGDATDPIGPGGGSSRVVHGGGWCTYAMQCRSAARFSAAPGDRANALGLRLARSLKHAGFERIAAGTFTMGSPEGEHGRDADEMQHAVTLTIDYEIMAHEVTQGEFGALMGYNPSGHASCGMICPVERVSWHETLKFANLLSSREGLPECFTCTGTAPDFVCGLDATYSKPQDCPGYRLPTEAEWEYAARAGSTTAYFNGAIAHTGCSPLDPNLDAIGWYCGNAAGTPHPVGEKQANAWGLYDMSGNVWEWTWDVYGFFAGDVIDPTGPGAGAGRVDRGGDYSDVAQECRSAARSAWDAAGRGGFLGFRLARSIRPAPPGLAWVSIPGGTYWMGCSPGDSGCNPSEMPRHEVTVPAFMMTETEVTQAQYMAVTGINPSGFPECGGDCPVENVTWHEAKAFCEANGGRLPSEAEWEYAARGGTATRYYCGNSDSCLDGVAWYDANSGSATHPVKGKEGNAFWLYDTLGNVWEWVGDCWHDDYTGAPSTGEVWSGGYCAFRILRGGAWHPNDNDLRSSMRDYTNDVDHYSTGGFRCVK